MAAGFSAKKGYAVWMAASFLAMEGYADCRVTCFSDRQGCVYLGDNKGNGYSDYAG